LIEVWTTAILDGCFAVIIDATELIIFCVDLLDYTYVYSVGMLSFLEDVLDRLGAASIAIMYHTNKDLY